MPVIHTRFTLRWCIHIDTSFSGENWKCSNTHMCGFLKCRITQSNLATARGRRTRRRPHHKSKNFSTFKPTCWFILWFWRGGKKKKKPKPACRSGLMLRKIHERWVIRCSREEILKQWLSYFRWFPAPEHVFVPQWLLLLSKVPQSRLALFVVSSNSIFEELIKLTRFE